MLSFGLPTYLTRDVAAGLVAAPQVARIHRAGFAAVLLAAGAGSAVAQVALPEQVRIGLLLFFVAGLVEQWNETAWVLIRGTRAAWAEPLTNTSVGLLVVAACVLDAALTGGLGLGACAGYVVAAAGLRSLTAIAVVGLWRHLRTPAPGRGGHLRRALPYYASDLLGLLYFRGDVVVLAFFVTANQVGEYVAAAAIINPAVTVAASMGVGALAYAAPRDTAAVEHPQRIVRFFTVAGQGVAGCVLIGVPVAVSVLFGAAGGNIGPLAMILALFLALRFTNFGLSAILLARGRASRRVMVLVLSIAGNVALNLALDGRYGARGAAWATVLTELIVAGSLLWFVGVRALVPVVVGGFATVAVAGAVMVVLLAAGPSALAAVGTGAVLCVAAGAGLWPWWRARWRAWWRNPAAAKEDLR